MIDDRGLRDRVRPGSPVTLVLGAGVSASRGLPTWAALLRKAWQAAFKRDPLAADVEGLERVRKICLNQGVPPEFVERLDLRRHPLELQFGFESIFDSLRWRVSRRKSLNELGVRRRRREAGARRPTNEQLAAQVFADLLRMLLYTARSTAKRSARDRTDTLSLVADAIRLSARAPSHQRLISQVITFNVDDLLEREVNSRRRRTTPYAIPVFGASGVWPVRIGRVTPIPVYHLHGFVPQRPEDYPLLTRDGLLAGIQPRAEALVFTDEQYWRALGNPAAFAARVFATALSGCCVFIGLSMTDLNLIRMLAQDATERSEDFRALAPDWWDPTEVEFDNREDLLRHFWITTGTSDEREAPGPELGERLLRDLLDRRGVATITIPGWDSTQFHRWWRRRFFA
jgi:SIR2-like domain